MDEVWKLGYELINLDQKLFFWDGKCCESGKFSVFPLFQETEAIVLSYSEQWYYSLIYIGGEIVLGVDHYCCKKEKTVFIKYTYRCPSDLDNESTEFSVKAIFRKCITKQIKNYYRKDGLKRLKVKYEKFDYRAEKRKEALENDVYADEINFNQEFAMEPDEYCSINTWIVYRAFPHNVLTEEENRYYALLPTLKETIYVGVKSYFNKERHVVSIEYSFDRYLENINNKVLEEQVKILVDNYVVPDLRKYYKKKGNQVNDFVKRFRKPLSFDPDEQSI